MGAAVGADVGPGAAVGETATAPGGVIGVAAGVDGVWMVGSGAATGLSGVAVGDVSGVAAGVMGVVASGGEEPGAAIGAVTGSRGDPSGLNFSTAMPTRAAASTRLTPSWIMICRISSRTCSNAGGGAARRSSSLMMCQPKRVCTGAAVTSPGFRANAASENSGSMSVFLKNPRSPPLVAPGSLLLVRANSAKSPPLASWAVIAFACASSGTRIWRARISSSPGLPAKSRS